MSVAIVVVLHDSAGHLPALLNSIARLPERPHVVCVDSGSRDDGAALARAWGAEVLILDANPGFGAANNAGLERVGEDVTVLLNPDCILRDAGVLRLAALAGGRDALLAPRLLNSDGSLQRSAHPLPGSRAALAAALLPVRLLPPAPRARLEPFRAERPRTVGWAIGACLVARTALLRRLGPFDPRAFLFYEDLDLCLRAHAAGVPVVLHPEVEVIHAGGHAWEPALGEPLDLLAARRREVVGARLGDAALARDDRAEALTFALRAAAGRRREVNRARLAALRAARGGARVSSG